MDIIHNLPDELIEIDYDSLDLMIQELPTELVEKIRRFTYKKQPSELLSDIIEYGALTHVLNNICEDRKVTKNNVKTVIKYMDYSQSKVTMFRYSTIIDRFRRHFKYKNEKDFILIDKIANTKSFGTFWGILHTSERLNVIKFIFNNN